MVFSVIKLLLGHSLCFMYFGFSESRGTADEDLAITAETEYFLLDSQFVYNDTQAREIWHPIAAAAFANDPQPCLTEKVQNAALLRKVNARCGVFGIDECSGYTAVSHYHRAIILCFRGTNQAVQYVVERFQILFHSMLPVTGGGAAGEYYVNAYNSVWFGGMKHDFERLKEWYPTYDLWITGYSLGGSMAAIAAHEIAATGQFDVNRMKVLTFGEPRTGDWEFAEMHNQMLPVTYRVVGRDDIIPQLPLLNTQGYKHYKYEVWYDNRMNHGDSYRICREPEDHLCSTGKKFTLSFLDHLVYFRRFIFGYADYGCLD